MPVEMDVLVIGCGISGAAAAYRLAENSSREITIITRHRDPEESNTRYAQGGIVTLGKDDSLEALVKDMRTASAGLGLPESAYTLAKEGPRLVEHLLVDTLEVPFDRSPEGDFLFTREGGHTLPRILHVGDTTGQAIEKAFIAKLRSLPNVRFLTGYTAVDLITSPHHNRNPLAVYHPISCHGAYVLERKTGRISRFFAAATVLATGGLGRIYSHTTNPEGSRGDGLAMAYRAGARVVNSEYIQFHPTTLAMPGAENFLISEAVRGEGAKLVTPDGRRFMEEVAPKWGDLAPRDVVARAIHHEMLTHGYPYVLLDLSGMMPAEHIRSRFPYIYTRCREADIDITVEPIPVVPAAHYLCGGVLVNEYGRTSLNGLYAVGEVSCTGLHGANRLASTSLLEGLVWGYRAGEDIRQRKDLKILSPSSVPPWEAAQAPFPDPVLVYQDRQAIQNLMWLYVGLSRNQERLNRALRDLNHLWETIEEFYRTTALNDDLIGLRNMAQAAWIVTLAAWHNRQSRGTHFREDSTAQESPSAWNQGGILGNR